MPKLALLTDCCRTVSIISPGTMKAPYCTPSTDWMRPPMADPNTTK